LIFLHESNIVRVDYEGTFLMSEFVLALPIVWFIITCPLFHVSTSSTEATNPKEGKDAERCNESLSQGAASCINRKKNPLTRCEWIKLRNWEF